MQDQLKIALLVFALVVFTACALFIGSRFTNSSNRDYPPYPRYGFIDTTGKLVIDTKYAFAKRFSEGLAAVRVIEGNTSTCPGKGKWGFVDRSGRMVIPPRFLDTLEFSEGLCAVRVKGEAPEDKRNGLSDSDWSRDQFSREEYGRQYPRPPGGVKRLAATRGGPCGYIDKTGRFKIQPQYVFAGSFRDGLAPVVSRDLGWHYINKNNEVVQKYVWYGFFFEGLTAISNGNTLNPEYSYINEQGNMVIKGPFYRASQFKDGLAVAQKRNEKTPKLINHEGKVVMDCENRHIESFSEELFPTHFGLRPCGLTVKYDSKSHLFDIKCIENYALVHAQPPSNRTPVPVGYLDKKGHLSVWCNIPGAISVDPFSDGLGGIYYKSKKVFVDKNSVIKCETPFRTAEPFSEGRSVVHTDYSCKGPWEDSGCYPLIE